MSARRWLNVITLVLIGLILFLSRHELVAAWHLLERVNIWVLLLLIPLQFLSYYAGGAMIFSYLRAKGDLKNTSGIEAAKMALELNFVNHILPSGGVSGASYMTWRLSKLGVNTGRATLAQVVRFVATFAAFAVLLVFAVLFITIDGSINRFTILVSCGLMGAIILGITVLAFAMGSQTRLHSFSRWVYATIDWVWRRVLRRKKELVSRPRVAQFFDELYDDYRSLRSAPSQLKKPIMWGFVFNIAETLMFMVTFLALGVFVNPAPILIAVGLAGVAGAFLPTPGGVGGYEAMMILFLTSAGVPAGLALAGVLLARVILVLLTIVTGYFFYHQALKKYGESPSGKHSPPSK